MNSTGAETISVACQHCHAAVGAVTVMGSSDAPGTTHIVVIIDCPLCLRPVMQFICYKVEAPGEPPGRRRRRPHPG
jgi:hypothetical protein